MRYIPLHIIANNFDKDTCRVLLAAHILTGCDATSKVGTKQSSVKANPAKFPKKFGKGTSPQPSDMPKAEAYLVQVLQPGVPFTTMDELGYYKYYRSKTVDYSELPPTSHSIQAHLLQCWLCTIALPGRFKAGPTSIWI